MQETHFRCSFRGVEKKLRQTGDVRRLIELNPSSGLRSQKVLLESSVQHREPLRDFSVSRFVRGVHFGSVPDKLAVLRLDESHLSDVEIEAVALLVQSEELGEHSGVALSLLAVFRQFTGDFTLDGL